METVTGMNCIRCNKYNSFTEGKITPEGTSVGYACDCGFSAILIIPNKGDCVEYKFVAKE